MEDMIAPFTLLRLLGWQNSACADGKDGGMDYGRIAPVRTFRHSAIEQRGYDIPAFEQLS
jgi:hypothetical protein